MKLKNYTIDDFVNAFKALLPPGAAWQWPLGGFGHALVIGMCLEFSRLQSFVQSVLDNAIEIHRPAQSNWHISEYRRVANEAITGTVEVMPRKTAVIGSHIGVRLWGHNAATENFAVPLIQIDHLLGPAKIGSKIGQALWGNRSRYILRVRYYRSVVDPKPVWDALQAFKQAHIYLWFEDITGAGGNYAEN